MENISKSFEYSSFCIKGVSFEIKSGERLALLAPCGSGKTSLLKIIGGVSEDYSGTVYLNNAADFTLPSSARNIAMYFEDFTLFPLKTLAGNLAYPLKLRKHSRAQIDERVHNSARLFCIEHLLKKPAFTLSPVQKSIAALARIHARTPQLILIDEAPLSGNDRLEFLVNVKKLAANTCATIIAAFSSASEACGFSKSLAVLTSGELADIGTHEQLLNSQNEFVRFFVR